VKPEQIGHQRVVFAYSVMGHRRRKAAPAEADLRTRCGGPCEPRMRRACAKPSAARWRSCSTGSRNDDSLRRSDVGLEVRKCFKALCSVDCSAYDSFGDHDRCHAYAACEVEPRVRVVPG
jgi:hypothetical protein